VTLLPLVYLIFTAPPVSIRRLTSLYILAFASAAGLLSLVGAKHVVDLAVTIGAAFTFTAWIYLPLRFLYRVARSGTLDARVFDSVSASVQFTYGFALTIAVGLAVEVLLKSGHALGVVALMPRLVGLASAIGVSTPILIYAMSIRPTPVSYELRAQAELRETSSQRPIGMV
jgi:hypothetical protein